MIHIHRYKLVGARPVTVTYTDSDGHTDKTTFLYICGVCEKVKTESVFGTWDFEEVIKKKQIEDRYE